MKGLDTAVIPGNFSSPDGNVLLNFQENYPQVLNYREFISLIL